MKGEGGREKGETPAPLLEQVFAHIAATRMAGLPILNPAVQVEVVGMQPWQGLWLGVLVTPWTMSLVLLPGESPLRRLALDEKAGWAFPSGSYEFMGLEETGLGIGQLCSLISPVHEFSTHQDAVAVAGEVMKTLFERGQQEEPLAARIESARLKGESLIGQPLSRRDFLRAAFPGGGR